MSSKRSAWLAVALAAAFVLAACARDDGGAGSSARVIKIRAEDIKYATTIITAKVGETVTVTLENDGALEHSLIIDDLNVKIEHVQPGQNGSATYTLQQPGTYPFYCDVPGHREAKMVGVLTVNP